jgi:peptide/nickel transport system permease protein
MATKKQAAFLVKRFKGFWQQFKRSKRGMLGLAIILFFGVIAITAPLLSPYDPLEPKLLGYYPRGNPAQAHIVCVPTWYKYFTGQNCASENVLIVQDHEFSSESNYDAEGWQLTSSNPSSVTAGYSTKGGSHDDDGCIKIDYTSLEESTPEKVNVTLSKDFEFPYNDPPAVMWMHVSCAIENTTTVPHLPVRLNFYILRGNEPFKFTKDNSIDILHVSGPVHNDSDWIHGRLKSKGIHEIGGYREEKMFSQAGKYTFQVVIEIFDDAKGEPTAGDMTIYIDNLQILLYGHSFGLLGTDSNDNAPRDLFTLLVYGTRISFMVGLLCAVFSVLIGLMVGLIAGYVGGACDETLMRFADFLLVLPGLPLLIVLVMVLGSSIWNIIGVIIFMGWMGFSRSVRSMVLSLRERPFIESAKAAGGGTLYIIKQHVLPNVFALVYVSLATSVPGAIVSEASLAWLGLGDINLPSWGMMLYEFERAEIATSVPLSEYWFWVIPAGVSIALMAMAFILIGFALDEILNPRLRQRR